MRHPGMGTRDCGVMDFATHADLTGRLRGLVILLDEQLTLDQARRVDELIDISEFGAALELLADWLCEKGMPIPTDLRRDFERIAGGIGNVDRVRHTLNRCPPEADA